MKFEGVGAAGSAMAMSGPSPMVGGKFHNQLEGAMGNVASLLGMTTTDMKSALSQTGGSLVSLGKAQGKTEQQVVQSVQQGLVDAGSALSEARLSNIATRIAHHQRLTPPATPDPNARPNFAELANGSWSAGTIDFYA